MSRCPEQLQSKKFGRMLSIQVGSEGLQRFSKSATHFSASHVEIDEAVAIRKVESVALLRIYFVNLTHMQSNPAESKRQPNHTARCYALNGQRADHRRDRREVGANVRVKNRIAWGIYLEPGKRAHLPDLPTEVAQRKQSCGLILIASQSLEFARVSVLRVYRKRGHNHRCYRPDAPEPGCPVGRTQRRPAYPVERAKRASAQQNQRAKTCDPGFKQFRYCFHKEIIT